MAAIQATLAQAILGAGWGVLIIKNHDQSSDAEDTFDTSKPDGTMRKVMDVSRIQGFGWKPVISLAEGIKLAYSNFIARCP